MVTLVDQMLDLHRKKAAGGSEQSVDRMIAATDSEIDRLVYELYGLTDEEIRIVEGKQGERLIQKSESFLAGSVCRALQVKPSFDKYIFIEKTHEKCEELDEVKTQYAEQAGKITIINEDAKEYLSDLCRYDWTKHRAVLILLGCKLNGKPLKVLQKRRLLICGYFFLLELEFRVC